MELSCPITEVKSIICLGYTRIGTVLLDGVNLSLSYFHTQIIIYVIISSKNIVINTNKNKYCIFLNIVLFSVKINHYFNFLNLVLSVF